MMFKANRSALGNQKGFTLVEMAIVLIIIGIILGAVLKGQDLIVNARAKKLTTTANAWSMLAFAYMDRMGRFPGDGGRNGIIGDQPNPEQVPATTAIGELSNPTTGMSTAPQNPVIIGGQSFWIYFGYDTVGTTLKNVMVICKDAACGTVFTNDELQIMQSVDTALDGLADAGIGQFRAATTAPTLVGYGILTAAQGGRAAAAVTSALAVNQTAAGGTVAWATTHRAGIWHFDRAFGP
jgi:prepilin-type N-terminal cleavage/methylation domain-containing protein